MSIYQDRFQERKFGIFNHFLYSRPGSDLPPEMPFEAESEKWRRQCAAFDPERVAFDLNKIGAGYYFITVMQGTRFMIAPNATFDRICGTKPGDACSERDLIAELIAALKKYDIDLCLYYTGDGPYKDPKCGVAFEYPHPRGAVHEGFVNKWAAVLEEYAVRYGDSIKAWWVDGCYSTKPHSYTQELLTPYYNAIKKGNPNALTTFNNGEKAEFYRWYEKEEFTSGEQCFFTHVPPARFVDGCQTHVLIPLGVSNTGRAWDGWCQRNAQLTREQLQAYIGYVNKMGGVVTLDIFIDNNGNWDDGQVAMLTDLMR